MSTSKEENTRNVVALQLKNYVSPDIIEVKSKDWVLNGRDNSFYQYVIDRHNGSPTNGTINNAFINRIYGKGLMVKNAAQNLEAVTKLKQVLRPNDVRQMVTDYQIFTEFSAQVIQTKGKKLSSINHIAKNLVVPSIENDKGEIERYFFSRDWSETTRNKPEPFPSFEGKAKKEIYVARPYQVGQVYFAKPDYFPALQYAESEEEIANLNINSIKSGLSAGYIINVPDGVSLTPEQQEEFKTSVTRSLTGSNNASSFIVSFNGRDESDISVTSFPVNENIHKQWQFLTGEARQQIITGHKVVSPMLFGVKDNTGLGNNANELVEAEALLTLTVIKPKQDFIIEHLENILRQYGINVQLEFIPLKETPVAPQATELSNHCEHQDGLSADELIKLGEDENLEDYYILDEVEVDYEEVINLATTGTARPNAKSTQDSEDIVIRYRYVGNPAPEREFCMKMVSAKKIYRKEDIIQMGSKAVNPGWGPNGANTYSIWLYKGGGNCKHKWNRVIYVKKGVSVDVKSPLAETISTTKARSKGSKVPVNDTLVSIAPTNMPNNGFLNN